jgi:hypothetical protein
MINVVWHPSHDRDVLYLNNDLSPFLYVMKDISVSESCWQ